MMKKFLYLTSYSVNKKIRSKSFIITNIVLCLLFLLITNLDTLISFFGGDFTEDFDILLVDNTGEASDVFVDYFEKYRDLIFESKNEINVIIKYDDVDSLKKEIETNKNVIIVFDNNEDEYLTADVITKGYINPTVYQPIVDSINKTKYQIALNKSDIDQEELDRIKEDAKINRIILDENKTASAETVNTMVGVLFPIVLLPFFLLILFLIQIIGGEINEEKTTRSMEIIISNVSAKTHLFSHLIADNIFIFFQMFLLGIYGAIGGLIKSITGSSNIISSSIAEELTGTTQDLFTVIENSGIIDKLAYVIPIAVILLVLSFFSYSFLAAVLASMSTNLEDYQQVQTPIMMILLAGFYLSLMSSLFEGSIFIKVLSFIPLISCLLSPTLLIVGQVSIIESIISIIIMIIFIVITYIYGMRIYRVGILNYSGNKIWKRMFKAARGR